jgi:ring-1,2-phenylacetyl-CoA epoxidase subunit PaaE
MKPVFHTLTVKKIIKETPESVSIAFEIPDNLTKDFQFKPGQYVTFKKTINGEEVRRSYSICSIPSENNLKVAVKKIENGLFSTYANVELQEGESLEVMTPTGNFVFPENSSSKNLVFFAVGSGITPIISLIKQRLVEDGFSNITLFYGNKGFHSIIFREEIEALKNKYMNRFRVIHVLSQESLGNPIQKGRIDENKIPKLIGSFLDIHKVDEVFVCGPEEMVISIKDTFIKLGLASSKVNFELFGTKNVKSDKVDDNSSISSLVTIILDGDVLDIPLKSNEENILDAALKASADLPFACKGGVCCTCKAKILEGTASMDVNYALEPDEVDSGYILTCQAHPTSEKLIVSFDE